MKFIINNLTTNKKTPIAETDICLWGDHSMCKGKFLGHGKNEHAISPEYYVVSVNIFEALKEVVVTIRKKSTCCVYHATGGSLANSCGGDAL